MASRRTRQVSCSVTCVPATFLWELDSKSVEQVSREVRNSGGAAKTGIHRARLQFQEAAQNPDGSAFQRAMVQSVREGLKRH